MNSDIQEYFKYVFKKKHGEKTDNPSMKGYVKNIKIELRLR